jgi:hypothetical protein
MDERPQAVLAVSENGTQDKLETESPAATALRVMKKAEMVTDSHRQSVNGSLLTSVCIMLIGTMATLQRQQIDAPLTIALVCFAIAIPILSYGYMCASWKANPTPGWLVLQAILVGGWAVESVGAIAVAVGLYCVILHISLIAFNALLWATLCIAFMPLLSFIGLIIYAVIQYKKHTAKQTHEEANAHKIAID